MRFKQRWLGLGWTDKLDGSRGFRDASNQVPVDVMFAGDFPGDGLPKPIAFPAPETASITGDDGIPYLTLEKLMELKIASGMTAPHRPRDQDDAIQLIRMNELDEEWGSRLDPYVHVKYRELWRAAQVREDE